MFYGKPPSTVVFHLSKPGSFWRMGFLLQACKWFEVENVCLYLESNDKADYSTSQTQIISAQELEQIHAPTIITDSPRRLVSLRFRKIIRDDANVLLLDKTVPGVYFDDAIMKPSKDEIFVDGGSYDMNSSVEFCRWCNNTHKHIYAFEPEYAFYEKCLDVANGDERLAGKSKIYNAGLWSSNGILRFDSRGSMSSRVDDNGNSKINVMSLDEMLAGEPVTFIKLDIEGAELESLYGMETTIKRYKPKLAISIYHKPDDCLAIPPYILSLVPDYKMYIRHYTADVYDTVLYCV
ncbi:hypothetical protein RsTz2092_01530 [Deferribacterales bacterium RsTz2092]|nr:hypothetical protein AGMMS49941_04710 [Deferribacterales bacterium]